MYRKLTMSINHRCGELSSVPGGHYAVLIFPKKSVFVWCVTSPGQLDSLCLSFPAATGQASSSVLIEDASAELSAAFAKRVSSKLKVPVFACVPETIPRGSMSMVESELLAVIQSF